MACYVPGCKSKSNTKPSAHLFNLPKNANEEVKNQWRINIPKWRNKEFDFKCSKICHLHFEDNYITKTKKIMMGDVVMHELPRKRWTLVNDAVPTKFSNAVIPKYFDKKQICRKAPKRRLSVDTPTVSIVEAPQVQGDENSEPNEINANLPLPYESQYSLCDLERHITLTPPWILQRTDDSIRFIKLVQNSKEKLLTFFSERCIEIRENGTFMVKVLCRDVTEQFVAARTIEEVQNLIDKLNNIPICSGARNYNMISTWPLAYKCNGTWYSDTCGNVLDGSDVCLSCEALKSELKKAVAKELNSKSKPQASKIYNTMQKLRKCATISRLKAWRLNKKCNELKQNCSLQLNTPSFEDNIDKLNISKPLKLCMKTSVKLGRSKSKYGMRYSAEWLLRALLFKIRSPKGYRHARDNDIAPLPHPGHLTNMIRGIPCNFGFNDHVFEQLKVHYAGKPQRDRQFVVLVDEMKATEGISFDKATLQFQGFIDFGEFNVNVKDNNSGKRADHVLVFMCCSLNSKMTQPLGAFATKGAAPGPELAKMILSCIVRLEKAMCEVVGVVCDGASTNKAAWNSLGIGGKAGNVTNKITNPVDTKRKVYFFCDMPHILKCIRNNMHKKEVVKFNGKIVNWSYFKALFDVDKTSDLRVVPKLSYPHVNPNPFQKMRVSYAAQIFSNSVARGLQFYREVCGNKFFKNSENTEAFTRHMNQLFDACNARVPKDGVSPNTESFKIISDFLESMSNDDTYASVKTMESLRVTLQSILEATVYLCEVVGYNYVLTAGFNQDKLEKFFGVARSCGGDDSHPTIASFSHLFRLLCLYTPTARTLRGNISTDDDCEIAIVSYIDTLKKLRTDAISKTDELHTEIEEKILRKILETEASDEIDEMQFQIANDHDYCAPTAYECVVYDLCGFLAYKANTLTHCPGCAKSIIDPSPSSKKMQLTALKDRGGLKYPTDNLVTMISERVEPKLSDMLKSFENPIDFIHSVVESIENVNCVGIGCSEEHGPGFLAQLIRYYLTLRCWFHCRNKNREIKSGVNRKNKMKLAKLS